MSFESRQAARQRTLDRVVFAYKIMGLVYMALHVAVAALAFKLSGPGAALLTLLSLGFGDLYWGVNWASAGAYTWQAAVAFCAATICFISWAAKPRFNRWIATFTAGMLADAAAEIEQITENSSNEGEAPHSGNRGEDA